MANNTKRLLKEFAGILSKESADRLESAIKQMRRQRNAAHRRRMARIVAAFRNSKQ